MSAREKLTSPALQQPEKSIAIDMAFFDLVNKRLDHIQIYNPEKHYTDSVYVAKKWITQWGDLECDQVTTEHIEAYLLKRSRTTSGYTANKDLRYLRALFNFGMHPKRRWINKNPTTGIDFFPVEKTIKYVPPNLDKPEPKRFF